MTALIGITLALLGGLLIAVIADAITDHDPMEG